jgi:hypothetical protein
LEHLDDRIAHLKLEHHIQVKRWSISHNDGGYYLLVVVAVDMNKLGNAADVFQEVVKFRRFTDWTRLPFLLRDSVNEAGWKDSKPYRLWGDS